MINFMAKAFCHIAFTDKKNFFSMFVQCPDGDLLRTKGFCKAVWKTQTPFCTFLYTLAVYNFWIMRIGLTQLGTRCSDCPREPSKQLIVLESPVKAEAEFI